MSTSLTTNGVHSLRILLNGTPTFSVHGYRSAGDQRFIEGTLYPKGELPSTVGPTLRKVAEAFACMAIAAPLAKFLPPSFICSEDFHQKGFFYKCVLLLPPLLLLLLFLLRLLKQQTWASRMSYLWASMTVARFSFYFAWLISGEGVFVSTQKQLFLFIYLFWFLHVGVEGSFVACGMAYNGKAKDKRTGKESVHSSSSAHSSLCLARWTP